MNQQRYLGVDLGAESGRTIVGTLSEGKLSMEEIHRFPNGPVDVCGTLHWDILYLYRNMVESMRKYVHQYGDTVDGIAVCSWAVDFGLLDEYGSLLQNPVCYRDSRTEGMIADITSQMPERDVFNNTGINMLPIYTLCQMRSLQVKRPKLLEAASTFLMIPDLLAYFLCGHKQCERTNAITTQMYDPREGDWSRDILEFFDIPRRLFPEIVESGTVLGELRDSLKEATGLVHAPVISPCSHDTGSAVAAVPARGDDWAFISSGTWSILGMMTDKVYTTDAAFSGRLCNELTAEGLFLCQNIMGLWLLQQARAIWAKGGDTYEYPELVKMAEQVPPGGPLVNANHEMFIAPADMVAAVREFCTASNQPPPETVAEVTRCILESLALSYRHALDMIRDIVGRAVNRIHVMGGGAHNTLLCQLTANATGVEVIAGPDQATSAGNLLVQAMGRGVLGSPEDMRETIRRSTDLIEYAPEPSAYWDDRYETYLSLLS